MGKRKKPSIDAETKARWANEQRQLAERVEQIQAELRESRERAERKRERLRRFSFGLLGR